MIIHILITIGLTVLIATPIILIGMLTSRYVISELWINAPNEMMVFQNGITDFSNMIVSFVSKNSFTIFISIILMVIVYILTKIYYEIRYKKTCKLKQRY